MYEDDELSNSSEVSFDSDRIDSDIEAELYSSIHYESTSFSFNSSMVSSTQTSFTFSPNILPKNIKILENGSNDVNMCVFSETNMNDSYSMADDKMCNGLHLSCEVDTSFTGNSSSLESDLYTSFETPDKVNKRKCSVLDNDSENSQSISEIHLSEMHKDNVDQNVRKKQKTNSPKKSSQQSRKTHIESDSSSDIDESIILTSSDSDEIIILSDTNAKEGNKSNKTQKKRSAAPPKNARVLNQDSSSSDSLTWSDNEVELLEIETNVDPPPVVALSSDSETDDSSDPLAQACSAKNAPEGSQQPSSFGSQDLWFINSEDSHRGLKRISRYHDMAALKCTRCKLKGHTVKFCTVTKVAKCFICGNDHQPRFCKNKICGRCYKTGHDDWRCYKPISDCSLCNMRGHPLKYCPDQWRRYHITTNFQSESSGKFSVANPLPRTSSLFCFNCGEQGHKGSECRMNDLRSGLVTDPSVISYEHPSETMKKTARKRKFAGGVSFPVVNSQQQGNCLQQGLSKRQRKKERRKARNENFQAKQISKEKKMQRKNALAAKKKAENTTPPAKKKRENKTSPAKKKRDNKTSPAKKKRENTTPASKKKSKKESQAAKKSIGKDFSFPRTPQSTKSCLNFGEASKGEWVAC